MLTKIRLEDEQRQADVKKHMDQKAKENSENVNQTNLQNGGKKKPLIQELN